MSDTMGRVMAATYIIDTDGVPCGYRLTQCRGDNDRSIIFQSDWDFPGLASRLGWRPSVATGRQCCNNSTDGTARCPECGAEAGEYISSAIDWIDEHCGEILNEADYPGLADYFEGSA